MLIPAGCDTPLRLQPDAEEREIWGRGGTGYTIPDLSELVTDVLLSVGCYGDGKGCGGGGGETAGGANKTNVARLDQSAGRFLFTRRRREKARRFLTFVVSGKLAEPVGSRVQNGVNS